jgi:hypothetical protein
MGDCWIGITLASDSRLIIGTPMGKHRAIAFYTKDLEGMRLFHLADLI